MNRKNDTLIENFYIIINTCIKKSSIIYLEQRPIFTGFFSRIEGLISPADQLVYRDRKSVV